MAVVASGSRSEALAAIEEMLADSSTFRTRVSAADRAAAKAKIYYGSANLADAVSAAERPLAVLALGGGSSLQIGDGDQIELGRDGEYILALVDDADSDHTDKESYLDFLNFMGGVEDDIDDLARDDYDSGTKVYWPVIEIRIILEPARPKRDWRQVEGEDYWIGIFALGHKVDG